MEDYEIAFKEYWNKEGPKKINKVLSREIAEFLFGLGFVMGEWNMTQKAIKEIEKKLSEVTP